MVKNDGILFLRDTGGRDVTSTVPRVYRMRGVTTMQIGILGSVAKNMLELAAALVCKDLE